MTKRHEKQMEMVPDPLGIDSQRDFVPSADKIAYWKGLYGTSLGLIMVSLFYIHYIVYSTLLHNDALKQKNVYCQFNLSRTWIDC